MKIGEIIPWKKNRKDMPFRRAGELGSLLDEFWEEPWLTPFGGEEMAFPSFAPRVDVSETDTEVKIVADLPGLGEKDVEVSVSEDQLVISGEKKEERETKEKNYYRMERSHGRFHREIPFPCEVNSDKAEAVFKKGVLTVTLPKAKPSHRRQIEIKPE